MLGNFFKKWRDNRAGTTAIEFSLLAIPFFTLLLGIIELSIMYSAASLLEGATSSATRLIRTGQVQVAGDPESMFRDALCDYATVLVQCDDLQINVEPLDSFSAFADLGAAFDEDGDLSPQNFNAGGSNDKMLVRVAYKYPMMTPLIGTLLGGEDSQMTFLSTLVFQTEPYEFEGA